MIVLVESTAGKYGEAGQVDYAVTKWACDCDAILPLCLSFTRRGGAGILDRCCWLRQG